MITTMIKYHFIVYHTDVTPFLEALQELGVADTQRSPKPVDEHSSRLMDELTRYTSAYRKLDKIKVDDPEPAEQDYTATHILQRTEELSAEKEQLSERQFKLSLEVEAARPWKIWDRASIERLNDLGLTPHFYIVSEKNFQKNWENEYILKIINREKEKVYFTVLQEANRPFTFPEQEIKFPSAPVNVLENELENTTNRLVSIDRELGKCVTEKDKLSRHREEIAAALDVYLTGKSAQSEVAEMLTVITAFVPEDKNEEIKRFLDHQQTVYLSEAAVMEDDPPIKLKNNKFATLFEPIGDMFMPPKYDELDVTKFFSPFYMLFFGFCLGDMGYGLIILLIATIGKFLLPKKMKSILSLGQLLGLAAMIMPVFSGTIFGMKIGELFPSTARLFFDDLQMFYLAIVFGGLQIIFAKLVQAFDQMKRNGFQHGLGPLGWALLLIAGALIVVRSMIQLPVPAVLIDVILYTGIGLVLFFSSLSKNIFKRMGKGITAAYDITGIFGDLLSYIRLFGLATAGGILGFVVNTIGNMIWGVPYIGWFIGGLVFLIGHIAVMALSALSAAVHPMRLTFVEFYKNVGFTGGGRAYNPLRKQKTE